MSNNSTVIAQQVNKKNIKNYDQVENNYLEGIFSKVHDVKLSCIFFLGEIQSQNAVKPLVEILNYADCNGCKIASALSLMKIGNKEGIGQVKKIPNLISSDDTSDENYLNRLTELWNQYKRNAVEQTALLK